jgi:predicted Fe-Mo cluster-binding NifX family protein
MPQYLDGSTQRLAQISGDYDPDGLPHFNITSGWGCLGVDLGANTIHDDATFVYFGDVVTPEGLPHLYNTDLIAFIDHFRAMPGGGIAAAHQVNNHQLDVFFVDERGRLYVSWVIDSGVWQGPVRISPAGMAPGGAHVATAHQVDMHQLDVFFVGHDGALHVSWAIDGDIWQGPAAISPAGVAPPGGALVAAHQVNDHQLDVLFIGNDGALYVSWVIDKGIWQGPVRISPPNIAPKGAGIAAAHQVDDHQLDVFFVGNDGALHVSWVIDGGVWQGPVAVTPAGVAPKGANVVAAHQIDNHQLDVFFIGNDGALYVSWVIDGGTWQGPVAITPAGLAPKGAGVAASHQVDNHQLDVFFIGEDGGLYVSWVIDGGVWQGPVRVSPPGVAPSGSLLATAHQTDNSQLDVAFVGHDRGLNVSWVVGGETWQGPVNVNDGVRLTPIRQAQHFYPFTYRENGVLHRIPGDGTPTGAFSYDHRVFVTFFHNPPSGQYFSGLSVTPDPFQPQPYDLLFRISTAAEPRFFQVAPCVIRNAEYAGQLPSAEGDGLIFFGHGWNASQQSNGVHLAWVPLRPGQMPQPHEIRYYAREQSPPWSPHQQDATLLLKTEGWSSISVGRVEATRQWVFLYQTCGGRDFPQSFTGPILARVADAPWDIGTAVPIEAFNPIRDNAIGRYLHHAAFPDVNNLAASVPNIPHPGFAYGPYLLNHYTTYDVDADTATIHYLMSTGKPYQVQVMRTRLSHMTR